MDDDDVTLLLDAVGKGTPGATERLIEAVHGELRRMASARMRREGPSHTLQATALVHEAYLRLMGNANRLEDRAHFFGAASKAMERVLIDHARERAAKKRGGDAKRVTLDEVVDGTPDGRLDLLAVRDAIAALETEDPDLAALVRQRYYIGMTLEQCAEIRDLSLATAKRRWTYARAWLYAQLQP